jgi:hypothetical protein
MAKKGFGRGRSLTRFSFTYEDLSQITNLSLESLRKRAQRGTFNPRNLISVLEFINKRQKKLGKLEETVSDLKYPIKINKLTKK